MTDLENVTIDNKTDAELGNYGNISTPETNNTSTNKENESIFAKVKNIIPFGKKDSSSDNNTDSSSNTDKKEETSTLQTIQDKLSSYIEVEKNYKYFFIVLGIGVICLMLSLAFLPFLPIKPYKFVSLFSLGSVLVISSFIFLHGTKEFLKMLFNKERYMYTIMFICSVVLGNIFSTSIFFITYICAVLQLISLIVFVLSFIPGGNAGISFMWSMVPNPFARQ